MLAIPPPKNPLDSIKALFALQVTGFVIAALYFARELFIPLALATLLTFLLSPLVTRLQRWIGRVAAVLVAVLLLFGLVGGVGWVLARQSMDLAAKLPDYKGNLIAKLRVFKAPQGGQVAKVSETIREIQNEFSKGSPDKKPADKTVNGRAKDRSGGTASTTDEPPASTPIPVQVIEPTEGLPINMARAIIEPVLGPLGTFGLVLVLVVCMLLQRDDLRGRFVRLVGQGRISATTKAMDDAASRVSQYLITQLMVNICYGIPIAIGLFFIGVPNALLWGGFAILLRFVPYAGPWIAALFPTLLSLAISPSWWMPVITLSLFITLELICGNVLEPLLYGSSTGVSAIALIMGAVFWAWLWGPVGLVLAAPMTVCLVVMGRHVPRLTFLSVLLSDEEPLTPSEECYQRLLAGALNDAGNVVEAYLKANSMAALCDSVLIPVITAAEIDRQTNAMDDRQYNLVQEGLADLVEDLSEQPAAPSKVPADVAVAAAQITPPPVPADWKIWCIPTRGSQDQLAAALLAKLLSQQGFPAEAPKATLTANEWSAQIEKENVTGICISVIPPSTIIHARYLCHKLRTHCPDANIVVGLWGASEEAQSVTQRLIDAGANEVVVTLGEALEQMRKYAAEKAEIDA